MMVYTADATLLLEKPEAVATALIVVVVLMVRGAVYFADAVVGVVPSSV